ncbi:hypothetical protein AVEN_196514-1 [Araneus ventricosus]|uniref:RING-type domain-containing protein n=1 Tax=Araneus ventricosus TaxID=182803 RepID=A0A4Y2QM99_ARAVE|nr:hypothetical protein AVEN_196514-1 [Araneus ventricosus]
MACNYVDSNKCIPSGCGYCYSNGHPLTENIKLRCGHVFDKDCLEKWYGLKEKSCPQCYFGDVNYQCCLCSLPVIVSQDSKDHFERGCECKYHRTCIKKLLDAGITDCLGCKEPIEAIDLSEMEEVEIQTTFVSIVPVYD